MIRAFVSSTFRDLKDHRAYVIDRLERCGIFVDPMEKWSAAGDEPKDLSVERVRDCDLCVLLVGFRRGHVPEGGSQGITQMEYSEALRREIEVLVFLADEEASWSEEALQALRGDPQMVSWRSELREHHVVQTFTPRPESLDVDAAVNRWLQNRPARTRLDEAAAIAEPAATIGIRAYGNSEGTLVVWRSPQPIEGCLGFALYRRVLGSGGVSEGRVGSLLGFQDEPVTTAVASMERNQRPIQRFRWFDRGQDEVRYRVVPLIGTQDNLSEAHSGSAWTRWISPRAGQTPHYRAFFNSTAGSPGLGKKVGPGGTSEATLVRMVAKREPLRAYMGGGLRQALIDLLSTAEATGRRLYVAVSDLDDPELTVLLKRCGKRVRLILGSRRARLCRELQAASVQVYERRTPEGKSARSNFVVLCDQWGAPVMFWSGSSPWTIRSLCLRPNNGILVESVYLARAYLDRWEAILDVDSGRASVRSRRSPGPVHVRENAVATTVWCSPLRDRVDIGDAGRLIRGARQGILFLVNERRFAGTLRREIEGLAEDQDLFIEGLMCVPVGKSGRRVRYEHRQGANRRVLASPGFPQVIESTIVLVDPFGSHPVVMTGSHDLSLRCSAGIESDLVIVENASGLAAEYAAHLLGLFDRFRFRYAVAAMRGTWKGLQSTSDWQRPFFKGEKRREFNFLFGSLSPGRER